MLNPNPDLVSWLAASQKSEWVIYQFSEWWETKWFMAHLLFLLPKFYLCQILLRSPLLSLFLTLYLFYCVFSPPPLPILCSCWSCRRDVSQSLTVNPSISGSSAIPMNTHDWSDAGRIWHLYSPNTDTRQSQHVFMVRLTRTCTQVHSHEATDAQDCVSPN